jgi:hypothetical protein
MQDGTQEGNGAYVILHRGARSRGYKHHERARARESPCVRPSLPISSAPPPSMSTCPVVNVCPRERVCVSTSTSTCLDVNVPWEGPGHPLL